MNGNQGTLFLLYNAHGSVMGKLRYGYRKITASAGDEPICAACDITHGGLSLTETGAWTKVKQEVETEFGLKVAQLHRDELPSQLHEYIKTNDIRLPAAIVQHSGADYYVVLDREDLARCEGSAETFVLQLRAKPKLQRASL